MNKSILRNIYIFGIILLLLPFAGATSNPVEALKTNSEMRPLSLPSLTQTIRVSVSTDGAEGNNDSSISSISGDGRYVVFTSFATNLMPDGTSHQQIFLRDLETNTTSIVSINNNGDPGDLSSFVPSISSNGRFVTFRSAANNLVDGPSDNFSHIYVRDLHDNVTTRVSVASNGDAANHPSGSPSISADGGFVTFHSSANNLDSRATVLGTDQVYIHDRNNGETTLISLTHDGQQPNSQSRFPSISADGNYIAYDTAASNMLPGQVNQRRHVYIYNRGTNLTSRISINSNGEDGDTASRYASISGDGRFVAFESEATNLVIGDTNGKTDVFVRDTLTSQTFRVSVASNGSQGNENSEFPSISANGRFVTFESFSSNLVSGDTNFYKDIFVHDLESGTTKRISVSSNVDQGNQHSVTGRISADGRFVTFTSEASNLVSGDLNNSSDIFVHRYPIKPSAAYVGNPTVGTVPLTVNFTNQSQGDVLGCFWSFGDGNTSNNCNPSHTYQNAGTYSVSLTAGGMGETDTEVKTGYITVTSPGGPVTAAFVGTPTSGTAPLTVHFTNQSQGDFTSCTWDFGEGTRTNCSDQSPIYHNTGTFTVSLEVSGPGGSSTETKVEYITVSAPGSPPIAEFIADTTSGTTPLVVNFTNQSQGDITSCTWNFGNGISKSCETNITRTYEHPGSYTVSLTVSGPGGTNVKTRPYYITTVNPGDPVNADFTGSPISGTAPLMVTFTNTSTGDYDTCAWEFGDGATSASCDNPSHTYLSAGVYTVKLTASGDGGTDTQTKTDYIAVASADEPVSADFSASPTSGSAPLTVAFTNQSIGDYDTCAWDFGNGNSSNNCNNPSHTYQSAGVYTVKLTISGGGGTDTRTRTAYITVSEIDDSGFKIFLPLIQR